VKQTIKQDNNERQQRKKPKETRMAWKMNGTKGLLLGRVLVVFGWGVTKPKKWCAEQLPPGTLPASELFSIIH
jgi:hypothetical protein